MKKITITIFIIVLTTLSLFAQNKQIPQQPQPKNLTPNFYVEDIIFVTQTLNTIEVSGAEVETFLNVKNFLLSVVQKINAANKQPNEVVQVEMPPAIAQNIYTFIQRAKLIGANAEKYQRFVNSLIEAAKQANSTDQQK